ncbi:SDR family NAD(P)-dependent oxidoreductase [Streptomyces sp. NPDC006458]|uniref:SDR family NAD(P)-dependent oxidoreductase n=1 Tax=Streptomyces sp. NPDC006458 TaxID=3154302 RepID=UPI0033B4EF8D
MGNFLSGKVVAVTGAGRGIGRAVARAAAAEGARVVVNDYGVAVDGASPTSEIADAVVKEIEAAGGEAVAVADDISTMAGGRRVVDTALSAYGRLDGAVCVAGILRERMLFNMSEEEWDPVLATHLKGTFTVFRAASAVMRRQRTGTLLGFTSGNHQGSVSQANYSAAKGGVISLVRSAALGLHKYGVTRLVRQWADLRVMRWHALRTLGGTSGPSTAKLLWAGWHQRLGELAVLARGAAAGVGPAVWSASEPYELDADQHLFLFSRADTIYGGSDQIQRTINAERVLGLPREPRG